MARLLVRGSVNIDEFFQVPHIVKSGETISSTGFSCRAGGKGANQAVAAAKAGADVSLAATLGNDGHWLQDVLHKYGVKTDLVFEDKKSPTGRAIIQLSSETRDNSIVLLQGSNYSSYSLPPSDLNYSHLLLQNEVPLQSTTEYLRHAAALPKVVTIFNPSPMLSVEEIKQFPWRDLTWLIVNEGEAAEISSAVESTPTSSGLSSEDLLLQLGTKLGNPKLNVVTTKGGDGVVALLNGNVMSCGPGKVQGGVKDTTGAGDCFTGYFATFLASYPPSSPSDLQDILSVASQAAAMCVEQEGAMESVPPVNLVRERMGTAWPQRFAEQTRS